MRTKAFICLCSLCIACSAIAAERIAIVQAPVKLPKDTGLGLYSPPFVVEYSGLRSGKRYVAKVWLLSVGSWFCASTQWCERIVELDNTDGRNSSGRISFDAPFDVYNYSEFDWVVRMYDERGTQTAFAERFCSGTDNRAPQLECVGSREVGMGDEVRIQLNGTDPDGDVTSYHAFGLPEGAQFDAKNGRFVWSPTALGTFEITFVIEDSGDGHLQDGEIARFNVSGVPVVIEGPTVANEQNQSAPTLAIHVIGAEPINYQWYRNGNAIKGATEARFRLSPEMVASVSDYSVVASNRFGAVQSEVASAGSFTDGTAMTSKEAALQYLREVMDQYHTDIGVYEDIGSAGNHFHARGKIPAADAPVDLQGIWVRDPHSGATCIRNQFQPRHSEDYGGFYFLNGLLSQGMVAPSPYFGTVADPSSGAHIDSFTGLDLSGATNLTFWAKGEVGGERIEFFFGGVGWNQERDVPVEPFADSSGRFPLWGSPATVLSTNWQKLTINLQGRPRQNLTNIMGGFAWVATANANPTGAVFYLDDIRFEVDGARRESLLSQPRFLKSFGTLPSQLAPAPLGDFDSVQRSVAVIYDNALAVLAFLSSEKSTDKARARLIGEAIIYAMGNDRKLDGGQLRSAYAAGDLALPPGWLPNGRRSTVAVPGVYDEKCQSFYELGEAYRVDTGNNAWAMIALLALYKDTHEERFLSAAMEIGNNLLKYELDTGNYPGFQGGLDAVDSTAPVIMMWSSTEHNLDVVAAFNRLYAISGSTKWHDGARLAEQFVEKMWNVDSQSFSTGTTGVDELSEIPNRIPLDVHAWFVLAAPQSTVSHSAAMHSAERNHAYAQAGFSGFDFNNDRDGVWFEGTAQMALAYSFLGRKDNSERYKMELRRAQSLKPFGNGYGISAATTNGLSTGFFFSYFRRLHIGATAWNIFAQGDFDPYYQVTASVVPILEMTRRGNNTLELLIRGNVGQNYRVDSSVDLKVWHVVSTMRLTKSPQLSEIDLNEFGPMYFRCAWLPE